VDYFYNSNIVAKYNNIILTKDYDLDKLNNDLSLYTKKDNRLFIENILNNNITQLKNNFSNMANIIDEVTIIINNIKKENQVYLSGMGKSGYVCKKCASTWQSLSIKCSYIDLPNLPHGDFGIFRDNDILILISNSGNTEEIVYILKYLKNNLNKKIITISIVANKNSIMEELSDFTYILDNIIEADSINMTPSTSSLIFMALLDGIAINLKKDISKDEFKMVHPAGSLGKR
jgi:arabinose-5-phosphate isomerase